MFKLPHQTWTYSRGTVMRTYLPWNLNLGEEGSIGTSTLVYYLGPVTIGDRATISHRARLCAGTHVYRTPLLCSPISIEWKE